jgi:hypothetical protein
MHRRYSQLLTLLLVALQLLLPVCSSAIHSCAQHSCCAQLNGSVSDNEASDGAISPNLGERQLHRRERRAAGRGVFAGSHAVSCSCSSHAGAVGSRPTAGRAASTRLPHPANSDTDEGQSSEHHCSDCAVCRVLYCARTIVPVVKVPDDFSSPQPADDAQVADPEQNFCIVPHSRGPPQQPHAV